MNDPKEIKEPGWKERLRFGYTIDLASGMVSGMGTVRAQYNQKEPTKETPKERIAREREEKKSRARVRPPRRL